MKQGKVRRAVGIDFGGTYIKMALVTEEGEIVAKARFPTREITGLESWLDTVAKGIHEMGGMKGGRLDNLVGIGVGVPGFVDYERGFVYDLANVPGWTGVRLASRIEERFKTHVRVDNDVNAMAVGECKFGVGRTYQHAVLVTLGTGVGGGILLHGKLYRGAYSMGGEIGHMSIDLNGVKSPQGRGGLEQYIGNRRIVERAVKLIKSGRKTTITKRVKGDLSAITPEIIGEAAHDGDKLGIEIFDFVADCLASAFASVTYLVQPQAFIVGGGVAQSGSILFDPLRRHLQERLSPFFAERIEVKAAKLGNAAGVIGAATLAMID